MSAHTYAYHSALGAGIIEDTEPMANWSGPDGSMQAFDITASPELPEAFAAADVLYVEPPWPAGWRVFYQRINQVPPPVKYPQFLRRASGHVRKRGGVIVVSAQARRYAYPAPHVTKVLLHPGDTRGGWVNALWYCEPPEHAAELDDAHQIIAWLATQHECVGDFCAGYGNTGRIFAQAGKRYVLSDLNPRCVGYVAEHAESWGRAQ